MILSLPFGLVRKSLVFPNLESTINHRERSLTIERKQTPLYYPTLYAFIAFFINPTRFYIIAISKPRLDLSL